VIITWRTCPLKEFILNPAAGTWVAMVLLQSEIFNPSSLASGSRTYISTLMKQLDKAKLLKK